MNTQRILDLCSGIGGFTLGAMLSGGFETVAFCEIDDYCRQVLSLRFPGVPIIGDIKDVSTKSVPAIDGIIAGFPCQPHSDAGKKKASSDERDLWPQICRILCEIQPRWAVFENVTGLLSSESGAFFRRILWDLASLGFDAEWGVISCADVGGVHRRERVWIIAYTQSPRRNTSGYQVSPTRSNIAPKYCCTNVTNANGAGLAQRKLCGIEQQEVAKLKRSRDYAAHSQSPRRASTQPSRTKKAVTQPERFSAYTVKSSSVGSQEQDTQPALRSNHDGLPTVLDGYLLQHDRLAEWLGAATIPSFPRLSADEVARLTPADREEYRGLWEEYQMIRRQHRAELAALGNAIVPQTAKLVFDRLKVKLREREPVTELIAYVDEVGRGTCFGPPVVCVVVLRPDCLDRLLAAGVTDSKKLTPRQRQSFLKLIGECAIAVRYGYATTEEINALNIEQAVFLAMRRAIGKLPVTPVLIKVDGDQAIPGVKIPQQAIAGGDTSEVGIAAASILAKEWRDALLVRLNKCFPGYGLARHKGYCVPEHRRAIARMGATRLHHANNKFVREALTNG